MKTASTLRLQRVMSNLGPAAIIGVLLILASLTTQVVAIEPLVASISALEKENRKQELALQTQPKTDAIANPQKHLIEKVLRDVFSSAPENNIVLLQGNYSLVQRKNRMDENYQFTFPVSGTYSDTRAFLATLMNTNPTLAIARIKISRTSIEDAVVESALHFELFNEAAE